MPRLTAVVRLLTVGAIAVLTGWRMMRSAAGTLRAANAPEPSIVATAVAGDSVSRRSLLKRMALGAALVLAIAPVIGFLIAASGIVPIKASSGHWAITEWMLNFSSQRSVSMHTFGVKAPELNQRSLVLRGAGAYDVSCRFCHGSPEVAQSTLARSMTPTPPFLPDVLTQWSREELFYIVKHGIKFTGMPAWPAQTRNDEVWAMVAFLLTLPGLTAEAYRDLVGEVPRLLLPEPEAEGASAEVAHLVNERCAQCHGTDGLGRDVGSFPVLAGQHAEYLEASLRAFSTRERHSGVMSPVASHLTPDEMRNVARYYAALPPSQGRPIATADALQRGAAIAEQGIPGQGVPACADCHRTTDGAHNPRYPQLGGQFPDYLELQLMLFKTESRGGTDYAHLMQIVGRGLEPPQMRDVALFYASLPPHRH